VDKAFYTVAEVADILGLGRSMTYRLVSEGDLPSVRLGKVRAVRVPAEGLRAWVAERMANVTPGKAKESQTERKPNSEP